MIRIRIKNRTDFHQSIVKDARGGGRTIGSRDPQRRMREKERMRPILAEMLSYFVYNDPQTKDESKQDEINGEPKLVVVGEKSG